MRFTKQLSILSLALGLLTAAPVLAETPTSVMYQGVLHDDSGPVSGQVDVTFALYRSEQGGTPIASIDSTGVSVDAGVFKVDIGALFAAVDATLFLEVQIRGEDDESFDVLPRVRVASYPFALRARVADEVDWAGVKNVPELLGAAGPAGAQGPAGVAGAEGPAGAQGPTGPAGAQGLTGLEGATGAVGAMGPMGPTGPAGAQGPMGPEAEPGPMGPTGAQGPTGPAGESVVAASLGPNATCPFGGVEMTVGSTVTSLCNGQDGTAGDPGESVSVEPLEVGDLDCDSGGLRISIGGVDRFVCNGADGSSGAAGAQGPMGPEGPMGPMGPLGATGLTGSPGPMGPAGSDGAPGATGPQGAPGTNGSPGPMGPVGNDGAPGATGPQGAPGTNGSQGPMGPAGTPGQEGPQGPAGDSVIGSSEPAGDNCPYGGVKFVTAGDTAYACNGEPGGEGVPGSIGPMGPMGPAGPAGAQGAVGLTGPAGLDGVNGAPGAVGPEGAVGPAGPTGDPGPMGPMGPQGTAGLMGPAGAQGPAGPAGTSNAFNGQVAWSSPNPTGAFVFSTSAVWQSAFGTSVTFPTNAIVAFSLTGQFQVVAPTSSASTCYVGVLIDGVPAGAACDSVNHICPFAQGTSNSTTMTSHALTQYASVTAGSHVISLGVTNVGSGGLCGLYQSRIQYMVIPR